MLMVRRLGVVCLLFALAACEREHGADVVGDQCLPDPIPSAPGGERGFSSRESFLQESSPDCQGHVCVVDRLDNRSDGGVPADPTNVCEDEGARPGCVSRAALERSVHCTCQCRGPGSQDQYCTCPSGFLCRELVGGEAPASFCVRPR